MANPLRIAYLNRADSPGIVTASSAQALLPATNLQTPDVRELWRATSGSVNVILDMGQSFTVHVVVLIRTNMAGADTVRVRMSVTNAAVTASLVHDSGVLTPAIDTIYKRWVYFVEPGIVTRYVRLDLVQSATAEAGRLIVAGVWAPSRNLGFTAEPVSWRDPSRRIVSLGDAVFSDRREKQRGLVGRFNGLTIAEARSDLAEINRRNGTVVDLLVCVDRFSTNLGRDTFWGLLENPIPYPQTEADFIEADLELWDRDRL